MIIYIDYESGALTEEEYRFLANRENRKERDEEREDDDEMDWDNHVVVKYDTIEKTSVYLNSFSELVNILKIFLKV